MFLFVPVASVSVAVGFGDFVVFSIAWRWFRRFPFIRFSHIPLRESAEVSPDLTG